MTSRRPAPLALCAALSALALASLAAPAQAAPPRTIAGFGEGAGEVERPVGAAVEDSSGDLYVADRNNFRVDKFDSEGDFLLAWGWGVADGTSPEAQVCGPESGRSSPRCFAGGNPFEAGQEGIAPVAVAVDPASHDVYVVDAGNGRVSKFSPAGEFLLVAGENEFTSPGSLAVDSAGRIWVGDADRLASLGPDGTPGAEISLPGAGNIGSLAIDSEDNFYVKSAPESAGIDKLHPDGTPFGAPYPLEEGHRPRTVAVDAADNLFIGHCVTTNATCDGGSAPYRFAIYDSAGEQVSQFGAGRVIGRPGGSQGSDAIAIDNAAGTLYAASTGTSETQSAAQAVQAFAIPDPGPLPDNLEADPETLLPATATLKATLNPEGNATEYRFEHVTEAEYENDKEEGGDGFGGPGVVETPPGGYATLEDEGAPYAGFDEKPVSADLKELVPNTAYRARLLAKNHCNPDEATKECPVSAETAFTTRTAVGIKAQWATDVTATSAILRAELDPLGAKEAKWWVEYGVGGAFDRESAKEPLAPGGPVSVRVALSGLEPGTPYRYRFRAEGDHDGVTYPVQGEPRGFATERGGLGFELPDSRAWEMVSPAEKFGRVAGFAYGSLQAAAGGEALAYLSQGSLVENPEGNRAPERSSALARREAGGAWSTEDLTPPHTGVRSAAAGGLEYRLFGPDLERALLAPAAETPLSPPASTYLRHNTRPPTYTPLSGAAASPLGADADLSHVLLRSGTNTLHEWSGGGLETVSVLPDEEVVVAMPGSGRTSQRGAVSADGSRVFWSTDEGVNTYGALYVRDTALDRTARLDEVQPGGFGTGGASPLFQGASADGRVAFFTDTRSLTEESGEDGRDLYRCELEVSAGGELGCELTDLSAGVAHLGESAEVLGLLPGIGADGRSAYFVAHGVLDEAANGQGDSAVGGEPNLYVWREAGGVRFIATLAEEADNTGWGGDSPVPPLTAFATTLSAHASPSGRYLAFMSERELTGYDNRDAATGERAQEVFRYDAATDELICASCNPSGARPGALRAGAGGPLDSYEFDPNKLWSGQKLAAALPEPTNLTSNPPFSLYRPRAVHDNGRLFFNAVDSLVPADSSGNSDVYQYEPFGAGSCSASAGGAGTALIEGGCVSLISSGRAEGLAAFFDASVGGADAFFYTPAPLAATDEDRVLDVYDARIGGVAARLSASAECLGEACQPPAAAPEDTTPASAAFKGPGNLRASARGRCAAPARGARRLARRAKRLRRHAKRSHDAGKSKRMRRRARRLARKARRTSGRAKRCRARANRRSSRR